MSALAGLSQQIVSAQSNKAPERALSKSTQNKSTNSFERDLKKFESRPEKKDIPVSKDHSVENKRSSSPEKTLSEKRIEERAEETSSRETGHDRKSLTKKEAMWAFLDRMDQELGVKPYQVIDAFSKLDVDNMMAPPEVSADEFVENLNLHPEQEGQALNLYSQLLTWTSAASLNQELSQKGQQAGMNVMDSQEYQMKQRMAGLNELSDKFFMNGQHTRDNLLQSRENIQGFAQQNALSPNASSDLADRLMDVQTSTVESKPLAGSTEELVRQMQNEMNQQEAEGLSQQEMAKLGLQQKLAALKSYAQPLEQQAQPVAMNTADLANLNSQQNMDSIENLFQPQAQVAQASDMSAFSGEGEAEADLTGNDFAAQDPFAQKATKTTSSEFVVKAPQPTETEMSENIREIINKAQVIMKKGGGEMKVSLRPEGMGNVNLKVNVIGGDVSVEMITESEETQKLLKKGLGELKDSLSLQKLNVDNIKVESMQEAADKLMEQRQEQAERSFQERFLQDFRNQNNSKWGNAFGVNPISKPGTQGMDEDGADERSKKSERRLDLVA